jgi:hypothetical protein
MRLRPSTKTFFLAKTGSSEGMMGKWYDMLKLLESMGQE